MIVDGAGSVTLRYHGGKQENDRDCVRGAVEDKKLLVRLTLQSDWSIARLVNIDRAIVNRFKLGIVAL